MCQCHLPQQWSNLHYTGRIYVILRYYFYAIVLPICCGISKRLCFMGLSINFSTRLITCLVLTLNCHSRTFQCPTKRPLNCIALSFEMSPFFSEQPMENGCNHNQLLFTYRHNASKAVLSLHTQVNIYKMKNSE